MPADAPRPPPAAAFRRLALLIMINSRTLDTFSQAAHTSTITTIHHVRCTVMHHTRAAAGLILSTPAPYVRKTSRCGGRRRRIAPRQHCTCTPPTPQHSIHTMASSKADAKKVRRHCPHARLAAAPVVAACCVCTFDIWGRGGAERQAAAAAPWALPAQHVIIFG